MKYFLLLFILITTNTYAQNGFQIEFHGGCAYNLPLPLTIEQNGEKDIYIANAEFYSEPFVLPPYWNFRVGYFKNDKGWEFEMTHHKLYLKNKTPEIEQFTISHGYNIVTINRAFSLKYFHLRIGLGTIFTHPETIIRGLKFFDDGEFLGSTYYISGPLTSVSIGKRLMIFKNSFVNFEAKNITSYNTIPISNGKAKFFHSSFHATFGVGIDF